MSRKRNEKVLEAERYGYGPCDHWKCPGCGVVLGLKRSSWRHITNPCPRFAEVIAKAKEQQTQTQSSNTDITSYSPAPLYCIMDINTLISGMEKLRCHSCNSFVKIERGIKNTLAFTLRIYCPKCPFELQQQSSPLIKVPSRDRKQRDIQVRLPATAQIAGLKYAQASQFLTLLGVNPPAETTWQGVSDLVFDSVEKLTMKSMQKAREVARQDNNLWVIIDCRWASRGHNSEQATVLVMDGSQDKVLLQNHQLQWCQALMMIVMMMFLMMLNKKILTFLWNKKVKLQLLEKYQDQKGQKTKKKY